MISRFDMFMQDVSFGNSITGVDLSEHFMDPDGDAVNYYFTHVHIVKLSGTILDIRGAFSYHGFDINGTRMDATSKRDGLHTITVGATDNDGGAVTKQFVFNIHSSSATSGAIGQVPRPPEHQAPVDEYEGPLEDDLTPLSYDIA